MIIKARPKEKLKWNQFVAQSKLGSFLQSWEWGEFQKSQDRKVFRLLIKNQDEIIGSALIVKHNLPKGRSYLYCPRGPVLGVRNWSLRIGQDLFEEIKKIGRSEKAIFWRTEPKQILKPDFKIPPDFQKADSIQPQNTLLLNLQKSEKELLLEMHYKTRYNIRLALKKGVKIKISQNLKDLDIFYQLLEETAQRNKIKIFPQNYYQNFLKILGRAGIAKLFLGEYQGQIIAAAIITFWGTEAAYIHGASSDNFRNLMAPHLLQWQAILEAKKAGCLWYDFWGIAPQSQPRHKWSGITQFKKGFGGKEIEYIGGLDYIFQKSWYLGYKALTRIKRNLNVISI